MVYAECNVVNLESSGLDVWINIILIPVIKWYCSVTSVLKIKDEELRTCSYKNTLHRVLKNTLLYIKNHLKSKSDFH